METVKVIQAGMGPLGRKAVDYLLGRPGLEIIAALEVDPDLIGKDVAEVAAHDPIGVPIRPDLDEETCREAGCAVLTTVSTMEAITPQVLSLVEKGVPVVTTCEELSYPWDRSPELAKTIDEAARANGVAVLGTGINPGFVMDSLPAFLTAVCREVESVTVLRYQDAASRRLPFQEKIGAGLTEEAFGDLFLQQRIRHVGLTESIQMIASSLGWELTRVVEETEPVIVSRQVRSDEITVEPGEVAGIRQVGRGFDGDEEKITLDFKAWIGEPEPRDTISIRGVPDIETTISGGINGDVATCAIAVNAIRRVVAAAPGLRTMTDIPPVTCFP